MIIRSESRTNVNAYVTLDTDESKSSVCLKILYFIIMFNAFRFWSLIAEFSK